MNKEMLAEAEQLTVRLGYVFIATADANFGASTGATAWFVLPVKDSINGIVEAL